MVYLLTFVSCQLNPWIVLLLKLDCEGRPGLHCLPDLVPDILLDVGGAHCGGHM